MLQSLKGPFEEPFGPLGLRIRLPLTGVRIPKIGSQSQKTAISPPTPEKGVSSQNTPHFYTGKMGFLTRSALFWGRGNWGFSTPEPSFTDFGDFDPCERQTDSQPKRPEIPKTSGKKSNSQTWSDAETHKFGNGPNTVSESTVSNTELSEFFGAH